MVDPIWPLPNPQNISETEIARRLAAWSTWHYSFQFAGVDGSVPPSIKDHRPLWRFGHLFTPLLREIGSLKGKRVLDVACNSGFWSIQSALRGAHVFAFDDRQELIDQARCVAELAGADRIEFRRANIWDVGRLVQENSFDVVLCLGIIYHLPSPYQALSTLRPYVKHCMVVDTTVLTTEEPLVKIIWEEPDGIQQATRTGIVGIPSPAALELMFRDLRYSRIQRLPVRCGTETPSDYAQGWRASWLVTK